MVVKRLKGTGNLADELIDVLFVGRTEGEMIKMAKCFLDNTLNHKSVDEFQQAQMVVSICWELGLNPPDRVKDLVI
ncbi:MAG: hypothetical protein H6822_06560 [Planctomycetaceae bacterium]|nr:hypothetical protein [Planctomycetales bacterium]MCB9921823.1 hypothetical protein [Planctomycetaceae bacterium]